ncbi:FMRFamide receptor [Strongyloides ratti]|uniref:FMRFamide receptor n=1 Tax=Strongyloides ratti TaxID=34506 RepID=A0A090MZX2_STRRB|nr:FMRFamide receptor [Strongyloides ratti]CEF69680.1 FMRFamide receptor [Strongyloides ratti]
MENGINNETLPSCNDYDGFTPVQTIFRLFILPFVVIFGITANILNIIVFLNKNMKSQLINWFFLVLSLSDIFVLLSTFFVFSAPVILENSTDFNIVKQSARILVVWYPIAQASHTFSIYITVIVSIHRYFGVCHPFLTMRLSRPSFVRNILILTFIFAITFTIPRWLELKVADCISETFKSKSRMVLPSKLLVNWFYGLIYKNIISTIIMFIIPFVILTFVNVKIIMRLKASTTFRNDTSTYNNVLRGEDSCRSSYRRNAYDKSNRNSVISESMNNGLGDINALLEYKKQNGSNVNISIPSNLDKNCLSRKTDSKDRSASAMLVAIVTLFLMCNILAFILNMIELLVNVGYYSSVYTFLVEVSTVLVTCSSAGTIVMYIIFGTKFRNTLLSIIFPNSQTYQLSQQSGVHSIIRREYKYKNSLKRSDTRTSVINGENKSMNKEYLSNGKKVKKGEILFGSQNYITCLKMEKKSDAV